jgi:hypothetical protein
MRSFRMLVADKLSRYSSNTLMVIKLLFSPSRPVPSQGDWDASRLSRDGISARSIHPHLKKIGSKPNSVAVKGVASDETKSNGLSLDEVVSSMHWISLVCFLEGIAPSELLLSDDLSLRIEGELAQLGEHSALDVYAAGLGAVM